MSKAEALAPLFGYVPPLLAPVHWLCPVGILDIYSAHRLSVVVNWIASDTKGKARASALQEVVGILVVLFGGETFLGMCTGQPPSWLLNPSLGLVFCGIHLLQTRTPLRSLMPQKPSYAVELALSIPDAIGRTLLLTLFSVVPLLKVAAAGKPGLPVTPSSLILVPFILAVPFGALIFSGTNFFSPSITLQTPAELRPWGWTAVDAWLPVVLPALFLSLIGPINGWAYGFGTKLSQEAAIVVCAVFTSFCFISRTVYNLAPRGKAATVKGKKVKKA